MASSSMHSSVGQADSALWISAAQPSTVVRITSAPSQRDGWRCSSRVSVGLYTVQNHPHYAPQIRVLRLAALHEPAEHILIFTFQQATVTRLVFFIQRWIGFFKEGHQQYVQFEHAPAAMPVQPLPVHFCRHSPSP